MLNLLNRLNDPISPPNLGSTYGEAYIIECVCRFRGVRQVVQSCKVNIILSISSLLTVVHYEVRNFALNLQMQPLASLRSKLLLCCTACAAILRVSSRRCAQSFDNQSWGPDSPKPDNPRQRHGSYAVNQMMQLFRPSEASHVCKWGNTSLWKLVCMYRWGPINMHACMTVSTHLSTEVE